MKVSRMIKELKRYNQEAEVKLHEFEGNNAIFVIGFADDKSVVTIADKGDYDLSSELEERFNFASRNSLDELDFFIDLVETGFTLEDIKAYLPEKYEYSKAFIKEHGIQ